MNPINIYLVPATELSKNGMNYKNSSAISIPFEIIKIGKFSRLIKFIKPLNGGEYSRLPISINIQKLK